MNKSYLIVPFVLLALFGFFYKGALQEMALKEKNRIEIAAQKAAEEKQRKDEIELKATEDAKKRQKEREEADLAREEKSGKNIWTS